MVELVREVVLSLAAKGKLTWMQRIYRNLGWEAPANQGQSGNKGGKWTWRSLTQRGGGGGGMPTPKPTVPPSKSRLDQSSWLVSVSRAPLPLMSATSTPM